MEESYNGDIRSQLRARLKKEIIQNNIYGVDIEEGAIEIARLRFWLSIVIDLDKPEALPNFDYKFMQGNSLLESYQFDVESENQNAKKKSVRIDLSGICKEERVENVNNNGVAIQFEEGNKEREDLMALLRKYYDETDHEKKKILRGKIEKQVRVLLNAKFFQTHGNAINNMPLICDKFFLWHLWFKDVFDRGGFDIVIGNPPYVAVKSGIISKKDKESYKRLYVSATGQFDLYALFLELGINILTNRGILTMITESTFASNKNFASLRKLLVHSNTILSIAYLGEEVFKSANVDVTISKIQKQKYSQTSLMEICTSYNDFLNKVFRNIHQSVFDTDKNNYEIKIRSRMVDLELFEKMKQHGVELGLLAELPRGVEFGSNSELISNKKIDGYYPLIVGKDIDKYVVHFSDRFIQFDNCNTSIYKELWMYTQPKIFIQRIRNLALQDRIVATYDEQGFICTNTLRMLYLKAGAQYGVLSLKYILGILNSYVINHIFRTLFLNKDIYKYQLEQLPIPTVSSVQQQEIIAIVDKILSIKNADPTTDTSNYERQIDALVYELYGITSYEELLEIEGDEQKAMEMQALISNHINKSK